MVALKRQNSEGEGVEGMGVGGLSVDPDAAKVYYMYF